MKTAKMLEAIDFWYFRAWHRRRIIASRHVIVFSKVEDTNEETVVDAIPMCEIDFICAAQSADDSCQDEHPKKSDNKKEADPQRQKFRNSFQVRTLVEGYNSGRAYYLKASSEQECADLTNKLSSLALSAKNLHQPHAGPCATGADELHREF